MMGGEREKKTRESVRNEQKQAIPEQCNNTFFPSHEALAKNNERDKNKNLRDSTNETYTYKMAESLSLAGSHSCHSKTIHIRLFSSWIFCVRLVFPFVPNCRGKMPTEFFLLLLLFSWLLPAVLNSLVLLPLLLLLAYSLEFYLWPAFIILTSNCYTHSIVIDPEPTN